MKFIKSLCFGLNVAQLKTFFFLFFLILYFIFPCFFNFCYFFFHLYVSKSSLFFPSSTHVSPLFSTFHCHLLFIFIFVFIFIFLPPCLTKYKLSLVCSMRERERERWEPVEISVHHAKPRHLLHHGCHLSSPQPMTCVLDGFDRLLKFFFGTDFIILMRKFVFCVSIVPLLSLETFAVWHNE